MLSKPVTDISKVSYPISSSNANGKTYVFKFNKYGPVIQEVTGSAATTTEDEDNQKPKYISVKKGTEIDMDRLKRGEYTFEELAEITDNCLGEFEGENVFVKTGRYGNYIEYGDVKKSIKTVKKPVQ
jgi:topoisomerase IA-like protein